MQIDAIGAQLTQPDSELSKNASLGQEEFLKLFLTELNFQDPLEPVDNKEFLAQIAEFSSLEQNRQISENIENLVLLNSTSQSIGILGKNVQIGGQQPVYGVVTSLRFSADGPLLTVRTDENTFIPDVRLSQVNLINL